MEISVGFGTLSLKKAFFAYKNTSMYSYGCLLDANWPFSKITKRFCSRTVFQSNKGKNLVSEFFVQFQNGPQKFFFSFSDFFNLRLSGSSRYLSTLCPFMILTGYAQCAFLMPTVPKVCRNLEFFPVLHCKDECVKIITNIFSFLFTHLYSSTYLFVHQHIHLFINVFWIFFIYYFYLFILFYSFIYWFTDWLIDWLIFFFYLSMDDWLFIN